MARNEVNKNAQKIADLGLPEDKVHIGHWAIFSL